MTRGESPVQLRGAEWVRRVGPEQLAARLGELTLARAELYVDSERVQSINTGDQGRLLLATVEGNRTRPYTVMITRVEDHDGLPDWHSRCSCPVATECKHVAATLLTARDHLGGAVQQLPAWRRFVQEQLEDPPVDHADDGVRLGLRLEATKELRGRRRVTRLAIRPAHVTKTTNWSKTSSWDEIALNRVRRRFNLAQADAVSALRDLITGRTHQFALAPAQLYLDDCTAGIWSALRDCTAAGVELLPAYNRRDEVRLLPDPLQVSADFGEQPDGSLLGSAGVVGLADVPGETVVLGDPGHGIAVVGHDGSITLAQLETSLSSATRALLLDGPLEVPAEDAEEFRDLYYPRLTRQLRLVASDGLTVPDPLRLRLVVSAPEPQAVHITASMLYAGKHPKPVALDVYDRTRDRVAEHELVGRVDPALRELGLMELIGGLGWWPVSDSLLRGWPAVRFVEGLEELSDSDDLEVVVDGELPTFEESTVAPQITIGATDSDESDWLDLHVTVTIDGEEVSFAELFAALAREDEAMLLASGTWFSLDRPELYQLERLIAEAREISDKEREGLAINRFHVGLWEELEQLGVVDQQSERWTRQLERVRGLDRFAAPAIPDSLHATLRSYQVEGFTWLAALWDCALGGVLADDMGLGKTLQTLALLARAREEGELDVPVLVVAPSSVVGTWVGEAARFTPDLRVVALSETSKRRGTTVAEAIGDAQVVVTSYAVLRLDAEQFAATSWNGLVLDEAQSVKNHTSKTFQAAKRIGAPFTLAVTGTPLENSLMDLWSMLALAAPGLYPRPDAFKQRYRKPIERGEAPELLDQLRRRIRPLMLRRTKEQVASDLPPKQVQVQAVELSAKHRQTYDRHLQRERQRVLGLLDDPDGNRVAILAALTTLRQLALDPRLVDDTAARADDSAKITLLVEQIAELAAEGHRALVFSQFTSFLQLARDALAKAGLSSSYLDGRTRNRQKVIDGFKAGDDPAFLISLKAGGVGLTLTEADYVFVLDPWWNPATEAQAIDRAHRIGQDKPVMVYRLVSAGTIEEKVVALQERKRELFEKVVDGDGGAGGAITPDDIRALLE
ncbi:DNA helicase [Flexivirga endophytica]|uniref:DNA helicase n=1 Tax=Flexivirga endophytica TaxID=1849103 RepID=A0A916WRV4_9MICO|nr:DEAD/DEAH box helicase [Flexivirga endophytica]GGB24725.1 DNA helicase [Flexivirga endophytica]GHB63441.1 DNA helicase [Flexivirga endophytica]